MEGNPQMALTVFIIMTVLILAGWLIVDVYFWHKYSVKKGDSE